MGFTKLRTIDIDKLLSGLFISGWIASGILGVGMAYILARYAFRASSALQYEDIQNVSEMLFGGSMNMLGLVIAAAALICAVGGSGRKAVILLSFTAITWAASALLYVQLVLMASTAKAERLAAARNTFALSLGVFVFAIILTLKQIGTQVFSADASRASRELAATTESRRKRVVVARRKARVD